MGCTQTVVLGTGAPDERDVVEAKQARAGEGQESRLSECFHSIGRGGLAID
jgi:hypothetical protein